MAVETASRLLGELDLVPGDTLLVSGASGGIGSMVVQFANQRGLKVIGTASREKLELLHGLGAIPTPYGPGLVERVKSLSPRGVDGVLDIAGSGIILELIELAGDPARVVSAADFSAPQYGARISLVAQKHPEIVLAEALRLSSQGLLRVAPVKQFPLDRVAEAYTLCSEGHSGKVVINLAGVQ